jgi:hypothetical protein
MKEAIKTNQPSQDERKSNGNKRRNESRSRTPERRNAGQVRCPSRKDDGLDGLPARENGVLNRKDGDHGCGEKESVEVHEEVPKEEASVENFGALKERYGDRHVAVGYRRQLKKRTQGDGGSRKNLAAACKGMTRRDIPTRRKGHCCQGQGKDKAVPRTQIGWTFEKRRQTKPEGISETSERDLKKQLPLRKERTSGRIFRQTTELEIAKKTVGTSIRLRKMNDTNLFTNSNPVYSHSYM